MPRDEFKDHFSGHAPLYAAYRPRYPDTLFHWLAEAAGDTGLAWDCAAGSGQATLSLARVFDRVVATDASAEQLAQAPAAPGVDYRVEAAEHSSLEASSVDLVFVSQALHWFDLDSFYGEVRRVLKPGGLIAALTYQTLSINRAVDAIISGFYQNVVGAFWPPERKHVEQGYANLPFPFRRIEAPAFEMRCEWRLEQLAGYLRSWSATRRYQVARGHDPVEALLEPLAEAWGESDGPRPVRWPLVVLAGRLPKKDVRRET